MSELSCWTAVVPACPKRLCAQESGQALETERVTLGTILEPTNRTRDCVCHQAPIRPPSTHTPLTHTVHMPVMEKADRLTGRRIQAVMREWSQGGGSLGVRTTGRWGRGGRPSYLEIFRPQSSAALAWLGREIKVQGLVTGRGWGGWGLGRGRGRVGNTSSRALLGRLIVQTLG